MKRSNECAPASNEETLELETLDNEQLAEVQGGGFVVIISGDDYHGAGSAGNPKQRN